MSTMPGTQQVDNRCHCNQECIASSLEIGSVILVYSPPERRLQTFLTCHQAPTQEPKESMSFEFLLLLVPWRPLEHWGVPAVRGGEGHHPHSMGSFLLDTAHPTPTSPALRGAT